ncbi:MAG: competence protein ComEC, partial [Rhodoferax sp.]|nr:competence protein ComEC [Rhodoferax sp.]
GIKVKADVLLVPHHGSQTSSTPEFLDAVSPRIALVQSGYRNRYGHPARPVMVRYEARGIQVVTSPTCGAALWQTRQPDRVICQRDRHARYWQHNSH